MATSGVLVLTHGGVLQLTTPFQTNCLSNQ